jgi:hypothetical protein
MREPIWFGKAEVMLSAREGNGRKRKSARYHTAAPLTAPYFLSAQNERVRLALNRRKEGARGSRRMAQNEREKS